MADARSKASVMGVPMKHISLITVRTSRDLQNMSCMLTSPQLTFQNSALILVRAPDIKNPGPAKNGFRMFHID